MSDTDRDSERRGRRAFLSRVSAAAASGLLLSQTVEGSESPTAPLPSIALGQYRLSRLIVGANPISGYSYLGPETDREMKAYFTPERTLEFLKDCERAGINTHQYSAATKATETYQALREQGSQLQLIGLHSRREDIEPTVRAIRPIAMVHHGGATDKLFAAGRSSQVRDFTKAVHDAGMLAGVSAHNPACIQRVADEGWEVDFFMTCFYFITRDKLLGTPPKAGPLLEGPDVGYKFRADDPLAMCRVIGQVQQPCLAFKILGAGRRCASQDVVRDAFRFAFEHLKSTDAVIVGMYPRGFDQIRANSQYTRQLGAGTA
jgi:hypothetical protein